MMRPKQSGCEPRENTRVMSLTALYVLVVHEKPRAVPRPASIESAD